MNHRSEETDVRDASCYNKEGVLTKKEVFKWSVQASLVQKGDARSDMFTFGPARNSKFCLILAMDPDKSEYLHNQFGVCLYRMSENSADDIAVKVSIALLDTRDRLHYTCEKIMRDSDRVYATFDCSIFDKHQQIFFRKDMLCIHCSMDVEELLSEDSLDVKDLKMMSYDAADGSRELVEDLKSLLETEKFCDMTLCAGGKEFQVHRSILGARSPVFAAMFEHETVEKLQNRVNIEDVDSDVMQQLLRYIYSGCTDDVTPAVSLSLLAAADKYSLPKLKKMCSHYLCSNLTTDMALNVLTVANLHGDEDLKEASIRVVLCNAMRVMKTDDWLTFLRDYSELANSIILRLAMKK